MPKELTDKGIGQRIKSLIQANPGRYSREECLRDLTQERPKLKAERYWKVLDELVDAKKVQILRSKGLALVTVAKKKKVKKAKKSEERKYYEPIQKILLTWLDYVTIVSDEGRKWKVLAAVPDVAGVKFFPSPESDELALTVVEVKTEPPNLSHLSQCFRYSRFADFCYVAISKEELQGYNEEYSRYLLEAERLGIGVISFWRHTSSGKQTYDVDLSGQKQTPDLVERQEYLADVVGIWKCSRCHTYHLEGEGTIVTSKRSEELAGVDSEDAKRFICKSCVTH